MRRFTDQDIKHLNKQLHGISPEEIIRWILGLSERPIVTTNFRPYAASLLHACQYELPNIKVIWCDTGYNTRQTYRHAAELSRLLKLNLKIYTPRHTTAYLDSYYGGIPEVTDPRHSEFTRQVKLEPFERAMKEHRPDVWFTNLRQGQTTFRDSIGILSYSRDGILKISPFYYWSEERLEKYLKEHQLPNEFSYYDPTKALEHRECGLHG